MSKQPGSGGSFADETTRSLVDKLKSESRAQDGRPEAERRHALRQILQDELGSISEEDAAQRLDLVRDFLVEEARQREGRLEGEVLRLKAESEALRAERNKLLEENEQLLAEGPAAEAMATGPHSIETVDRIRNGLRKLLDNPDGPPDTSSLRSSEARLFLLAAELLLFALRFETGQNGLLMSLEMGPGYSTRMWKKQQEIIKMRFRSALDYELGSVQALKETLEKTSRFLIDLNEAYTGAIRMGSRELLEKLAPQPILDKARGGLGTDWKGAWQSLETLHSDMCNLTPAELWEIYFSEPFRKLLTERTGSADGGTSPPGR